MTTKVSTTELKLGMFVADLDRPWVDTPFLLQGFVIEDERQIAELRSHCDYVIIDRARSTGKEFAPAPLIDVQGPQRKPFPRRSTETQPAKNGTAAVAIEDPLLQTAAKPPRETKEEFQARTALLPPGITAQTYRDEVSVEQEVPRARAAVAQASDLLDKLVEDIRLGRPFEVERVDEIVVDMVESIVRNPDALMWVARLREQDASTYGHGLQVSVYLTSFGRHLGFPKEQLAMLAQIGLLLDIGKIRLPKELLEKQGKLSEDEFAIAKKHVDHSLDILAMTPNFDEQVLEAIGQHHERLNGSGYPKGIQGDEISIYGRMAGITDCFAALIKRRPYADAVSSYEALRSLTSWGGELFQEALVQQFVSSVGVFPVGSLIELSTGEVAVVVAHNKVRRLKPRVLIVTGPDKTPAPHPTMVDLLYDPKLGGDEPAYIKRGLPAGAYGLDLRDFYLA